MNFCTKCGNQLKTVARYCGNCGSTIDRTEQSTLNAPARDLPAAEVSSVNGSSFNKFTMQNSQRRIVYLWYILGVLFLFCVFLPSVIGLDGFDGGFAISFVAGFMVIISLVIIFIYRSRAKQLDRILSGEGRIAVWHYSPEEWLRFITRDFEEEKKLKRMLFFLISGISVVIGTLLTLYYQNLIFVPIILGLIVLIAIPAIWVPRYRFRKLQGSEAKALIAENGVLVGKMFHLWVKLGASLDKVSIDPVCDPCIIEFAYSMPTRNGRQEEVARVPVPYGRSEEAMSIVEHFNLR